MKPDVGFSHVALPVRDIERSLVFYRTYAGLQIVHRRTGSGGDEVVWLGDPGAAFVLVLIEVDRVTTSLAPLAHLGVGCESRERVDRLCAAARAEGRPVEGPHDSGEPIGYWAFLTDPDGHTLEISFGQEVGRAVEESSPARVVARFFEMWNRRDLSIAGAVIAEDCVTHQLRGGGSSAPSAPRGPAALEKHVREWLAAFPDLRFVVESQQVDGDLVTTRCVMAGTHLGDWQGVPASGREVTLRLFVTHRVREGRIVEDWSLADTYGLLEQIGVLPSMGETLALAGRPRSEGA